MRTIRLYHPEQLACGKEVTLTADASSHLVKVLRAKPGTVVTLFNGDGFDYRCTTLDNNTRKTRLAVETKIQKTNESNLHITLIQGLSRHDRMDTTIQKSIELGANRIIPVLCQRTNTKLDTAKKDKKLSHWKKVAISACEQSGRCIVPDVDEITTVNELCSRTETEPQGKASKLLLNPEAATGLNGIDIQLDHERNAIEIFIGPEGGLNDEEIQSLADAGFTSISFGPRILRTETAGPAVISALQTLWGDF